MKGHEIFFKITRHPVDDTLSIFFCEERQGKIYIAKSVELVYEEYKPGAVHDPTLQIWQPIANEFLKALAEELKKYGVRTVSDDKMEGILEATKLHLEDMRDIVFKTSPPKPKIEEI